MNFYLGQIQRASAVKKVFTCHFQSESELNLVIAKGNIIEIYTVLSDSLTSNPYININGQISILEKITKGLKDCLFVLTEDLDWAFLSHSNLENRVITLESGSVKEQIGKRIPIQFSVDINQEYIVISAYQNLFKVIQLTDRSISKDFNFRYFYEDLLSFFTVYERELNQKGNKSIRSTQDKSMFGVIKTVSNLERENTSMQIDLKISDREINQFSDLKLEVFRFTRGIVPWDYSVTNWKIDLSIRMDFTLAFSPLIGGLLLFTTNKVEYFKVDQNEPCSSIKYFNKKFFNYTVIDENRYLVSDTTGGLFFLGFINDFEFVFQFLGLTSPVSSMCYLDNQYVFIGSRQGNSQLIRILNSPCESSIRPQIEIVENFPSLAPIVDFTLIANEESNPRILSVSGSDTSCSLKTVQKGSSLIVDSEIPIQNVKEVFTINISIRTNETWSELQTLIIINLYDQLLMLRIDQEEKSISEYSNDLIMDILLNDYKDKDSIDFFHIANNEVAKFIILLTPVAVYLLDQDLNNIINKFTLMSEDIKLEPIRIKYKKAFNCLYILTKNNFLVQFDLNNNTFAEILSNRNICAFDVNLDEIIAFSCFDTNSINIVNLKRDKDGNFKEDFLQEIDRHCYITSIKFLRSEGFKYLLCSASNGILLMFKMQPNYSKLVKDYLFSFNDFLPLKQVSISKNSFSMMKIQIHDSSNQLGNSNRGKDNLNKFLFLNTEFPSMLSIKNNYANVTAFNAKNCREVLQTNNPYLSYMNVFLFENSLVLGNLSNHQTQNISGQELNSQVLQLEYLKDKDLMIYLAHECHLTDINKITNFVICDKNNNEIAKLSIQCKYEVAHSFCIVKNGLSENKSFFALGTAVIKESNQEPESGRIILVEMSSVNSKIALRRISEKEVQGGVLKVVSNHNDLIYASISGYLAVLHIDSQMIITVISECNEFTYINEMYLLREESQDTLIVADIYRSVSLWRYIETKRKIVEISRDFSPIWMSSVCGFMRKNTVNSKPNSSLYQASEPMSRFIICCDIDSNILVYKSFSIPRNDEENYKLEKVAQIHLGERVNKFIPMQRTLTSNQIRLDFPSVLKPINVIYTGTVEGTFLIMAELDKEDYEYLHIVQKGILNHLDTIGDFNYDKYRSFKDNYLTEESTGFVDGSILEEFLVLSDEHRKKILKEINYPWQKSVEETIYMIETLKVLH